MNWITRMFSSRSRSALVKEIHRTRGFLRLVSPAFDQSFQLPDGFSLELAKSAQKKRGYFLFNTYGGRRCAINFANIHAIQHSESLEIESSSYEIEGVRIYFASDAQPLEIFASYEEIAMFFSDLASGAAAAQLAGWTIEKARVVLAIASSEFQEYLDMECHD